MSDRAEGPKSLWVTGHMRSGTSMTAGLFAQHGVFFGRCGGPRRTNRKGSYENLWLKRGLKGGNAPDGWPASWEKRLRREGWDVAKPWGAKAVAVHWPEMRQVEPSVVVLCYRPKEDILASCERFGSGERFSREHREPLIREHWDIMAGIEADYHGTVGVVIRVDTPDLVAGDYTAIVPAFDALGIEFSEATAREWIDPGLFHA